jgi:glycosyltransferase involved in cell wall biosynthesis
VIVGVRGIPNRYSGFERFVEVLAPYLVRRGHDVTVLCEGSARAINCAQQDLWQGVRRRFIRVGTRRNPLSTVLYDLRSFLYVRRGAVVLAFGYGTALFQLCLLARGVPHAVNMDGIEWRRAKWGRFARAWLRANEFIATRLATELVADHPEIQREILDRLSRPSHMIPYGVSCQVSGSVGKSTESSVGRIADRQFHLVLARPEPENQIHILLMAYRASSRACSLIVVGDFSSTSYGRALIRDFPEANFVGPIYDHDALNDLRVRSSLYLHGHSVGGTNPSLIEAMAAGAVVVAHDNPYNRWVLGDGGLYFSGVDDLVTLLDEHYGPDVRAKYRERARAICLQRFTWEEVLGKYEAIVDVLAEKVRRR